MERDSSGYSAFNGEGYKLELTHYNNSDIMHIDLEAPIEAGEYTWPSSRVASLIPVPESNIGKIEQENEGGFTIWIADTTREEFNEYIESCRKNGFTEDYERGDTYYRANNSDGYHISLSFEGFNTMFIRIDEPNKKK